MHLALVLVSPLPYACLLLSDEGVQERLSVAGTGRSGEGGRLGVEDGTGGRGRWVDG